MNQPRTGLRKSGATDTSASTSTRSSARPTTSPKKKKETPVADLADAFARGNVTLGQALGLTAAQKDIIKTRAFALLNEQRFDVVTPILEGLVALDPFDVWSLMALAGIKLDTGDPALAATLLDRAIEVQPLDVTARALRAEARARTGDADGARQDLAQLVALKADPNLPAVRRARALELTLNGAVPPEVLKASDAAQRPATRSRAATSTPAARPTTGTRSGLRKS